MTVGTSIIFIPSGNVTSRFRPLASFPTPIFDRLTLGSKVITSFAKGSLQHSIFNFDVSAIVADAIAAHGVGGYAFSVSENMKITLNIDLVADPSDNNLDAGTYRLTYAGEDNSANLTNYPDTDVFGLDAPGGNADLHRNAGGIGPPGYNPSDQSVPPWGGVEPVFEWISYNGGIVFTVDNQTGTITIPLGIIKGVDAFLIRDSLEKGNGFLSFAIPYDESVPSGRTTRYSSVRNLTEAKRPKITLAFAVKPNITAINGILLSSGSIAFGPIEGGNTITLTGTNLDNGGTPRVAFDTNNFFSLQSIAATTASPTEATFVVPPSLNGADIIDLFYLRNDSGDGNYTADLLQSYEYKRITRPDIFEAERLEIFAPAKRDNLISVTSSSLIQAIPKRRFN